MSGYSVVARNMMLNYLATFVTHVSLHNDEQLEIVGGGYNRQPVDWSEAENGKLESIQELAFMVPAGAQVIRFGIWDAEFQGTYYGGAKLKNPEHFTSDGVYTIISLELDLNIVPD